MRSEDIWVNSGAVGTDLRMHRIMSALRRIAAEFESMGDGSLFCDAYLGQQCGCRPSEHQFDSLAG